MFVMQPCDATPDNLRPGLVLRHFKFWLGDENNMLSNRYIYQVITIAEHTETKEKMMVYQQLYAPFKTYCRPVSMVFEPVDTKKYPRATQQKYRFEIVGEVNGQLEV